MNYIIFGGAGFIGTHLIHKLKTIYNPGVDHIIVVDIVMPGEEGVVPGVVEHNDGVEYIRGDVRKPIKLDFSETENDIIFNLAAVHRTPGHQEHEYFETNILGAQSVTTFAKQRNIKQIVFTSSIAPYGASEDLKTENSLPMPNSPYGISKLVAEEIHKAWAESSHDNKLIVLRPGIVFGKGEHGNYTRLYWGIRKRYFCFTGRKDTIKACIYVKDLVEFMIHCLTKESGIYLYNCTYEPAPSIEKICDDIMLATNMKRWIPLIPGWMLMFAANILGPLGGKKVGIHPERVKKLMISTNISGKKMAMEYQYKYSVQSAIADWFDDCDRNGLT